VRSHVRGRARGTSLHSQLMAQSSQPLPAAGGRRLAAPASDKRQATSDISITKEVQPNA